MQNGINKVILSVNNFLGEGPQEINRVGSASDLVPQQQSSSDQSVGSWLTSIPEAIGAASVAAIKFITPTNPATKKIDNGPSSISGSFSEIQPSVNLNQITFGILGVAALGTVGYGLYANS